MEPEFLLGRSFHPSILCYGTMYLRSVSESKAEIVINHCHS